MMNNHVNFIILKEHIVYDPTTGVIKYIKKKTYKNRQLRYDSKGYLMVSIDGKSYRAHRVIWFYMKNSWPENEIDHINGVKDDNRWCNLRDVTLQINQQNRYHANKNNKTKLLGVSVCGNKFRARIIVNKKFIHLGLFNTAIEAHKMYLKAKSEYHL